MYSEDDEDEETCETVKFDGQRGYKDIIEQQGEDSRTQQVKSKFVRSKAVEQRARGEAQKKSAHGFRAVAAPKPRKKSESIEERSPFTPPPSRQFKVDAN